MTACDQEGHGTRFRETGGSRRKQKTRFFRGCGWGPAAAPAAGGGLEGAAGHGSRGETRETRDLSQSDFCSRDGTEETGRGCGDVWVYCHLGVKSPH